MKGKILMATQEASFLNETLIGNKAGLLALREAIDQAIISGESEINIFSTGNEECTFTVLMNDEASDEEEISKDFFASLTYEESKNK
jgi:hypothetical protein